MLGRNQNIEVPYILENNNSFVTMSMVPEWRFVL